MLFYNKKTKNCEPTSGFSCAHQPCQPSQKMSGVLQSKTPKLNEVEHYAPAYPNQTLLCALGFENGALHTRPPALSAFTKNERSFAKQNSQAQRS
jgi:hypothetical protein